MLPALRGPRASLRTSGSHPRRHPRDRPRARGAHVPWKWSTGVGRGGDAERESLSTGSEWDSNPGSDEKSEPPKGWGTLIKVTLLLAPTPGQEPVVPAAGLRAKCPQAEVESDRNAQSQPRRTHGRRGWGAGGAAVLAGDESVREPDRWRRHSTVIVRTAVETLASKRLILCYTNVASIL